MKTRLAVALLVLAVLTTACYHATIDSGLPASGEVIKNSFASGWIFGLVPPSTVETASQCPNGVAKVETQLSFVNQLVGFLTIGIYTPMEIKVTCAAASGAFMEEEADFMIAEEATSDEVRDVFALAAHHAVKSGRAVYVRLGE